MSEGWFWTNMHFQCSIFIKTKWGVEYISSELNKTKFYSHWLQGFIFMFYAFTLFLVCWEISVLSEANLQRPPHSPVTIMERHHWSINTVSHWQMKLLMFSNKREEQSCSYYVYWWKLLHWRVRRNRQHCVTSIHHLTKIFTLC